MRFEEIARQLVETTSRLVRGRIINIMDTEGRIVASTEESRIGTLHAGACQVVRTGRPVAIEPADLARWPGAREGYNLPVFSDGRLIAVVGIFGEPEQVRDSAYILAAYTEQFFHQNALDQQNRITGELRTTYLRLLLNLDRYGTEELTEVGEALGLRLQFPVRVLALEFCGRQDALVCRQRLYRAVEELQFQNLLDPKRDVWAVTGDRLLMLKSDTGTRCLHRMLTCAETAVGAPARLGAGRPCQTLRQAPQSGAQALTLCAAPVSGVQDIQDPDCRFLYLMQRTAFREEDCIREMHSLLERQLDAGELEMLLATADAYYDCGGSVGQAADRLHIHKNTLQYRMHRLWDIVCPGTTGRFEREYLLRLCIQYHVRKASEPS